jgi:2'-5' RNA ligase
LFIAFNLPDAEKERIHDASARLRGALLPLRWVATDALHVTLLFLGEVDAPRTEELSGGLVEVGARHSPFGIELSRVGAFPNLRRPRVLWIGVRDDGSLRRIQEDVAATFERMGFALEARDYSPHLTIARVRNDARAPAFASLPALAAETAYESRLDVNTIDLMRSHLRREGARYERLAAVSLVPAATSPDGPSTSRRG